jgi:hypothetical protein
MATKLRDALPAVNTPPQAKSFVRHYAIGCVRTTPNVGILKPCGKLFVQGWRAAPLFSLKKSLQPCVPATPRPDNDALHSSRRQTDLIEIGHYIAIDKPDRALSFIAEFERSSLAQ